jgi:hypothetical protein
MEAFETLLDPRRVESLQPLLLEVLSQQPAHVRVTRRKPAMTTLQQ